MTTAVLQSSHNSHRSQPAAIQRIFRMMGGISPELTGRLAHFLWYRTMKRPWTKEERSIMETAHTHVHQYKGKSVQVYEWGQGPSVLLVHGWSGHSGQMSSLAQALVKQGYRVTAFDAPGHGRSSGRRTDIEEISELIQRLGHQADEVNGLAAVISHSFGGMSVMKAIADGLNTRSVVCISPPKDINTLLNQYTTTLMLSNTVTKVLKRLLEQRFGSDVWIKFSIIEWAKSATMPGLIVHDAKDRFVSVENGQQIHRDWTGSKYLETSGLGHSRILKDENVIQQVAKFIELI